jgi:7,8-dihydropterin-6-yl-methyl-4-(beta-D-ribofuranosyl)aminobenzene 5'-phosphate synthase
MKKVRGRLTVLSDNLVGGREESLGEHGFSIYVETEKGNLLFDTGRGRTIVHNAITHGKDLGAISKIVLSHGHPDHTGGLPEALRFHKRIDVLGHPDMFLHRFRREKDGEERYNGIPYTKGYLERLGAHFLLNESPVEVLEGIYLTGSVPRETDFEAGDLGNRFALRDGKVVPEIIQDDQSLIIETARGVLIILGCAHSGLINIINHALRMIEKDKILGIVGGTHLGFSGQEQTEKTIDVLRTFNIEHFIPAHCTGMEVSHRLRCEFGGVFQFCHVGLQFGF